MLLVSRGGSTDGGLKSFLCIFTIVSYRTLTLIFVFVSSYTPPPPPPHTHTHTQRVEILQAAVQLIYKLKEELAGLLLLRNEPNESNKYNGTTHCTTRYPVANRPTVTGS